MESFHSLWIKTPVVLFMSFMNLFKVFFPVLFFFSFHGFHGRELRFSPKKRRPRDVRSQEIFKGSGAPFCLAMPWGDFSYRFFFPIKPRDWTFPQVAVVFWEQFWNAWDKNIRRFSGSFFFKGKNPRFEKNNSRKWNWNTSALKKPQLQGIGNTKTARIALWGIHISHHLTLWWVVGLCPSRHH